MGCAGAGAGRRQGVRVQRHQRPAGPAPRRGQAQPDGARAQCRHAGLHRRGAGDRLAADPAAPVRQRRNPAGQPGYFEAAAYVRMLEIPARLDRAEGDVHAGGNPHIQTDPRNIALVADALAKRLARSMPPMPRTTRRATRTSRQLASGHRNAGKSRPHRSRALPSWCSTRAFPYLQRLAGLAGDRHAGTQARRGAQQRPFGRSAGAACSGSRRKWLCVPPTMTDALRNGWPSGPKIPAVALPFTVGGNEQREGPVRPVRRHPAAPAGGEQMNHRRLIC